MEWLEDMEKTLGEAELSKEESRWGRRCIYRVPACIKDLNPKAYRPQLVSLGPFHHGNDELLPMEEHKRRAVQHLLLRCAGRPAVKDFVAAVEDVLEELQSSYADLGAEWRGSEGSRRFVGMMVVDGCFLLEVMRAAAHHGGDDYVFGDPIFSPHGVDNMMPYIRRDMLMLENQLPVLLLQKLVAVETSMPPKDEEIYKMVLRFFSASSSELDRYFGALAVLRPLSSGPGLCHPLGVLHGSMLHSPPMVSLSAFDTPETDIIQSATELYESGIRCKKSSSDSLYSIGFEHRVLRMPAVLVDESTEYELLNMMAFERLHAGAGNLMTAYVFFMGNIIVSAGDVALLVSEGIIQNAMGSDRAVADLFSTISKGMVLQRDSPLDDVHRKVSDYCRKPWVMWRANIMRNYFRTPTSFINFLAAATALILTVMQTAYAILSFNQQLSSNSP